MDELDRQIAELRRASVRQKFLLALMDGGYSRARTIYHTELILDPDLGRELARIENEVHSYRS